MASSSPISLVPESQDLKLYAGDGVELLVSVSSGVDPVELTGTIAAQIRSSRADSEVLAEFGVDIYDAPNGLATLSLSGDQSRALHGDPVTPLEKFTGVWDVQWTPDGGEPETLVQGSVESNLDVTRS
jgi:hypothetical protein